MNLSNVLTVRIIADNNNSFELQSTDFKKRIFKCGSDNLCQEWVCAIRNSVRLSSNRHARVEENELDSDDAVAASMITHKRKIQNKEFILSRNPGWNRLVFVDDFQQSDEIRIFLTNGLVAKLNQSCLETALTNKKYEVRIPSSPLSSYLTISVSNRNEVDKAANDLFKKSFIRRLLLCINTDKKNFQIALLCLLAFIVVFRVVIRGFMYSGFSFFRELSLLLAVVLGLAFSGGSEVS